MELFEKIMGVQGLASRIATLDVPRINVMNADTKPDIRYLPLFVTDPMREAEYRLRKELAGFRTGASVDSNINVFHDNSGHQRKMLSSLEKLHSAMIEVGKPVFDLLVSPWRVGGRHIEAMIALDTMRSAPCVNTWR